jgi:hypothetical protein
MGIRDLKFEIANPESTESVVSAQAAKATLYKDLCDIKTVDVSAPKGLSSLLSSGRAEKQRAKA